MHSLDPFKVGAFHKPGTSSFLKCTQICPRIGLLVYCLSFYIFRHFWFLVISAVSVVKLLCNLKIKQHRSLTFISKRGGYFLAVMGISALRSAVSDANIFCRQVNESKTTSTLPLNKVQVCSSANYFMNKTFDCKTVKLYKLKSRISNESHESR